MSDRPASEYITPLVDALRRKPTSAAISGTNRFAITHVAVGLARRLDPGFRWIDIRRPGSVPERWELALESSMATGAFRAIDAATLHPDGDAAYAAASLVRPDGSADPKSTRLAELLLGSLRGRPDATGGPGRPPPTVLLLTNVERASAAFDGRAGSLRPYIEAFNAVNVTVLLSACSRPRENKSDVDYVLRVEPPAAPEGLPEVVVTETNRADEQFPPVPPGSRYSASPIIRSASSPA